MFFVAWSACDKAEILPFDIACFTEQLPNATIPKYDVQVAVPTLAGLTEPEPNN